MEGISKFNGFYGAKGDIFKTNPSVLVILWVQNFASLAIFLH